MSDWFAIYMMRLIKAGGGSVRSWPVAFGCPALFAHRVDPAMDWSTKEKLAIASYALRAGEEQWGGVGRLLQPLGEPGRPDDWFSPEVCAEQYTALMDNRSRNLKKQRDANDNLEDTSSKEMIVQALTMERIEELKRFIQKEQEEYLKIQKELELVESGALDDELDELWDNINAKKLANEADSKDELAQRHPSKEYAESKDEPTPAVPSKDEDQEEMSVEERARSAAQEMKQEIEKMTLSLKATDHDATSTDTNSDAETSPGLETSINVDADLQSESENAMSYACEVVVADSTQEGKKPDDPKGACQEDVDATSSSPPDAKSDEVAISPMKKTVRTRRNTSSVLGNTSTKASTVSETSMPKIPNIRIALNKLMIVHNHPQPDHSDETESADESVSHDYHHEQMISAESHGTDDDSVLDVSKMSNSSAITQESMDDSKIIVNSTKKDESVDCSQNVESSLEMLHTSLDDSKIKMKPEVVLERSHDDSMINTSTSSQDSVKDRKVTSKAIPEQSNDVTSTPLDEQAHMSSPSHEPSKTTSHDSQRGNLDKDDPVQTKIDSNDSVNKPSSLKITKSDAASRPTNSPNAKLHALSEIATKSKTPEKSDVPEPSVPTSTKESVAVCQTSGQSDEITSAEHSGAKLDAEQESGHEIVEGNEPDFDVHELVQQEGRKMAPEQEDYASNSGLSSPSCTQSSDNDTDTASMKAWRKSIMILWKQVASHRYASLFQQPVTDDIAPNYSGTVHRSMDLSTLKKNIENGVIRTTSEFQRDLMLMFQNAIMYNYREHDVYKMTLEMQKDVMDQVAQFLVTQIMVNPQPTKKTPRKRRKSRAGEKRQGGSNRVCATTDVLLSVLVSEARSKRTAAIEGEAKFMRKKQPSHEC